MVGVHHTEDPFQVLDSTTRTLFLQPDDLVEIVKNDRV